VKVRKLYFYIFISILKQVLKKLAHGVVETLYAAAITQAQKPPPIMTTAITLDHTGDFCHSGE